VSETAGVTKARSLNIQQSEMSTWKLINSSRKPGLPTLHCPLPIPHSHLHHSSAVEVTSLAVLGSYFNQNCDSCKPAA